MRQLIRLSLALVMCFVLGLPGVRTSVPNTRSADTGTWTQLAIPQVDGLSLAINPVTPATLFAGTRRGVFRSTDGGATWVVASTGLATWPVRALAINPVTPTTLFAGTEGGGVFRSSDSGTTWTAVNVGLVTGLTSPWISALAIDPATPTTLYAGTSRGVFRSTDSGTTWVAVNTGLTGDWAALRDVRALAINPVTPTTLFAGTEGGGVFRSSDSGTTWTAVNTGLASRYFYSLAVNPLTPTTVYAGAHGGTGLLAGGGVVYFGGGLFRSTDNGTTWTAVNTGLQSDCIYSLAVNPLIPTIVYAGTSYGVFRSTDSGATWNAVGIGLTSPSVHSLAVSPTTPAILYAVTSQYESNPGSVFRYDGPWYDGPPSYILTTTASPIGCGVIYVSPDASAYVSGTVVTISAAPAAGYAFIGWLGDLSGSLANPSTITMDADKRVTASFAPVVTRVVELTIGSSTMLVDGRSVFLDSAPTIREGRTLLPIRAIVEAIGGTVAWNAMTRTVTVAAGPRTVSLTIDNRMATVNGTLVSIDAMNPKVVPIISGGRTLLPVRFVAEQLGGSVGYNPTTQTITLTFTL